MTESQLIRREDAPAAWHAISADEVLERLKTPSDLGLTDQEAVLRLEQYGRNELKEKPRATFLKMIFDQLNNFVIILLIVASVVSAVLGDYVEAGAILLIVVLNSVLGVIQESRAEEALAALKKLASPEAQVLRNGRHMSVPASELVPGDIVFLEAGNYIPADLRLTEAVNLRVEEAALTGESVPVQKNATAVLETESPLGDRKNTAFMGTVVSYGRGRGVVTATGMHTQLGMIADMLQSVEEEETPLQQRLDQLGRLLGWGALAICAIVFLMGLLRSNFSAQAIVDTFMIAVSLAIAAVPEGLPAVVTISLALGMREMVHRHALIRRLASVETLGSATVICSDKTGTLTQNAMTVTRIWVDGTLVEVTGSGYNPEGDFRLNGQVVNVDQYPGVTTALWIGVLNNDAQLEKPSNVSNGDSQEAGYRIIGDPTEGSILVAAAKAGILQKHLNQAYPRQNEVPFDSVRKRMVTVHNIERPLAEDSSPIYDESLKEWDAIIVKGAPDVVLRLCTDYQTITDETRPLDAEMRQRILEANDQMTKEALRVLGLAYRIVEEAPVGAPADKASAETSADASSEGKAEAEKLEEKLIFAGLVGMIDPARTEVRPALEKARSAGIRTVMITGDYPNTARAIAESISLLRPGHQVLTGAELNAMDDASLAREVENTDVFARVSPEHKMRIVDALRANNEVVAMTGDGVNDAPAIKRSDIGVAMGITGTDVAKETADMVLTDDNYASIVAAVEQGRIIYANIRKFVFFLLSSNVAEIMIIFLSTLAGLPTPLTAIQLLWLNLLTDGAPALALAMEKGDPDVMKRPPRPKNEQIINRTMGTGIIVQTIAQTGAVLGAFILGLYWHLGESIPAEVNAFLYILQHDWRGLDVQTAETMAFVTLSLAELFRAYTVRSERVSLFELGVFSNRYMQYAVGASIVLLLLVVNVPFLQPIFNTHFLSASEWAFVIGLALIPAVCEEITKFALRRTGK